MEMRPKNVEASAETFLLRAHWNVWHILFSKYKLSEYPTKLNVLHIDYGG